MHIKFPNMWDVMKLSYGNALVTFFESDALKKLGLLSFIRGNRPALSLFVDLEHILHIENALKQGTTPITSVLRIVLQGHPGLHVILGSLKVNMTYHLFIETIERCLKDLEFHDFKMESVNDFKMLITQETQRLCESGFERFQKLGANCNFLTQVMDVPAVGGDGVAKFMFEACWKNVAINTGVVPMLPWEAVLFEVGAISGVAQTIALPECLYQEALNARESCLELLGKNFNTLTVIKKEVNAAAKSILRYDTSFILELTFLNQYAMPLIVSKMQERVINALPTEVIQSKMSKVPNQIIQGLMGLTDH